jgi:diguanylate cyclase (GGDEF)-like protein/PAS domain S-box-containing protein
MAMLAGSNWNGAAPANGNRARVLLVDDQRTNLLVLARQLQPLDIDLVETTDPYAVLDLMTQQDFAAVLLDVHMPGLSGIELAGQIRANEQLRDVPLIFVSANDNQPSVTLQGYEAGAVDFLRTPVDPVILRSKVRIYCDLKLSTLALRNRTAELEHEAQRLEVALQEAKRMEQELVEGEVRYRALVELSPVAIVVEVGNAMQYINTAVLKLLGAEDRDILTGRSIYEFLHGTSAEDCTSKINEIVRQGGRTEGIEGEFLRIDGTVVHVEMGCACVVYEGEIGVQLAIQDVTERKRLEQELRMLSQRDGLTGIANRRFFDETIDRECRRAGRNNASVSLVMLDIDAFKKYNDHYGHQAGDQILKQVAGALNDLMHRGGDVFARYGGEEFVAVLPETTLEGALHVAEQMRLTVSQLGVPHAQSPAADHVTVSIGVATNIPGERVCPVDLVSRADRALYQSKAGGRNRVTAFAPQPIA